MTLREAINTLSEAGIESAEHDAKELFRAFGGAGAYIPRDAECASQGLARALARRAEREPLQYIIGKVGFYLEEYKVSPAVLIPRSDTEHLVDYATKNIPEGEFFIDLCTGSGCVAISTLKNTRRTSAVALDISPDALNIAAENAAANGVSDRLTLIEGDVLSGKAWAGYRPYAVLSNPPYVSKATYAALEPEIYSEPECAFVGGEDGGDFYRAIIPTAATVIKPEGFIALEIGYDQAGLIRSIAAECGLSTQIIKDYSSLDRVAVLRHIK